MRRGHTATGTADPNLGWLAPFLNLGIPNRLVPSCDPERDALQNSKMPFRQSLVSHSSHPFMKETPERSTFRAQLKRYLPNELLNKTLAQSGCGKVPAAKVNLRKYVFIAKVAAIGVDIDHGPVHLKERYHFRDIGFDH